MAMDKKKVGKFIGITAAVLGSAFVGLSIMAKKKKPDSVYDNEPEQKNPLEGRKVIFVEDENDKENADGVKGHLKSAGVSNRQPSIYQKYIKRGTDIVLSFGGLVLLSPIMGAIALAIKSEDPGPALFVQKRVGQNKQYFKLHKFRSMRLDTPHDVPTHQLENPEHYITKVGKFIRAHSLDELPQIWDIFIGNMSVIGPRPALWNQDCLTAERDQYGANDVKPGLTGWAQINGRDELEIPEKARLDGEYVKRMGPIMDAKCFLASLGVLAHDDSVVEGGTGVIKKAGRNYTVGKTDNELIGHIGFGQSVKVDLALSKKVLITGAGSYIGESFRTYASEHYKDNFIIDTMNMHDSAWKEADFSQYDIVFHVAGIAHADVGNVDDATKAKYYAVNTDLAVEVCEKAKAEGVKTFILMSSMIVYGDSAPYGKRKVIDEYTVPAPANFYGDSKLQADVAVRSLADEKFKVIVLRPPMIYGKDSKGNYPALAKLAKILPVFPDIDNERSMLHIDNLCEFLCQIMLVRDYSASAIVLIPQNSEWVKTSNLVREIGKVKGQNVRLMGGVLKLSVKMAGRVPGKIGRLVHKAFGNYCYKHSMSQYASIDYQKVSLNESVKRTEGDKDTKSNALIVASVASMIEQFNMQNIQVLLDKGYHVDVACNCKDGNTISDEKVQDLIKRLAKVGVPVIHVPIPRTISNVSGIIHSTAQLKQLLNQKQYVLMHCHSPIGAAVARTAAVDARKRGMIVIYTAHGFHFYKGAPKKNWAFFYPIEKELSKVTDVLVTINREDFVFAKKHLDAGRVEYVPGVGIETKKFKNNGFDKSAKRAELGIHDSDFMILSVGELNQNKNHKVVVKTIAKINNSRIHYFIAGKGDEEEHLKKLADQSGVNLHLLGYRTDIAELLNAADIYVFPSYREGLSVSLMEAMAAGLPCVVSRIRGNVDLIVDKKGGYLCNPSDVESFAHYIAKLMENKTLRDACGKYNIERVVRFDTSKVLKRIKRIYP